VLFTGIQIHAYSILDEGSKQVVDNIQRIAGAHAVYPTANYVAERQPYPDGELPHNPTEDSTSRREDCISNRILSAIAARS